MKPSIGSEKNVRNLAAARLAKEKADVYKLSQDRPSKLLENQRLLLNQRNRLGRRDDVRYPLGQTIFGLNDFAYSVTGVIEKAPENSHLTYSALISWSSTIPGTGTLNFTWLNRWITQVTLTYLLLAPEADPMALENKLLYFMQNYMPQRSAQYQLYLQALSDIHLRSSDIRYNDSLVLGSINHVHLFSAIAVLILLIACINFVNLSTARASKRAREVGIRKVLGAYRRQLSRQFLGESIFFSLLAVLFAGTLVELLLPTFNAFTGKTLRFDLLANPLLLWGTMGISFFVGILSGIYPVHGSFQISTGRDPEGF